MTKLKINKSLYYIHQPNSARIGLDPCLKGSLIGVLKKPVRDDSRWWCTVLHLKGNLCSATIS